MATVTLIGILLVPGALWLTGSRTRGSLEAARPPTVVLATAFVLFHLASTLLRRFGAHDTVSTV